MSYRARRIAALAVLALAASLLAGAPQPASAAPPPSLRIAAAEARRHVDEEATVCGLVARAYYAASARGRPTFLDFDHAYPEEVFRVVIWGVDREKFPHPPERLYGGGKRFCVTGRIQLFRGKPEIVAHAAGQIRAAEED
jgi:DNA/RNA endonuclease YhcR with UshA esterase domain